MMHTLVDDVLAQILNEACKPVAWPWSRDACVVCRRWRALCVANRRRGWYLAHSSLTTPPIEGT